MNTKHTPGPWDIEVVGHTDGEDAQCVCEILGNDRMARVAEFVSEDDAIYIVRCVNSHDDLLAALKLFANIDLSTPSNLWSINTHYCEQARAAIAKAEGR